MTPPGWRRVSKRHPCPICAHGDWCCVREDGTAAACTRVEEGCARRKDGTAVQWDNGMGWIHDLVARCADTAYVRSRAAHARPVDSTPPPTLDWYGLCAAFQQALPGPALDHLAGELGVSAESLAMLWTGWSGEHGAYTFPMFDDRDRVVGVRLRRPDGFKWAIEGSRNGLFHMWRPGGSQEPIVVCEGPTDAAALWDMGFWSVGRAACRTNLDELTALFGRYRRPCLILADNDGPGIEGAAPLADRLCGIVETKVLAPPWCKDARAWRAEGAKASHLLRLADATKPWRPDGQAAA